MKYMIEDITIYEPLKYDEGLIINYSLPGYTGVNPLFLSDEALMLALEKTFYISGYSLTWHEVEVPLQIVGNPYSTWENIESYMRSNISVDMAKQLVLHYLNNKTEKP